MVQGGRTRVGQFWDLFLLNSSPSIVAMALHGVCFASQGTAATLLPKPSATRFALSDLSLLVPLQARPQLQTSHSPFGRSGTGFCNAPTLDLGDKDPIMSQEQWQDWAKDVLLAVLPLPADAAAWPGKVPPASELLQQMRAVADVDTVGDCPDPVAGDLLVQDVAVLRQVSTNVATQQSLPRGSCSYRHWRVVGARFDPCPFQTKVLADDPEALTPGVHPKFPFAACGGAELRLVVQPFIREGSSGYRSVDMAMHLFYRVPDLAEALVSLHRFKDTTRRALGSSGPLPPDADVLLPHPGLRLEMDCGGYPLGDGDHSALGPVGKAWRLLLSSYAKSSRLFKVAWALSDNSGGNWSFGLRLLQPVAGKQVIRRLEPFKVETFTAAALPEGMPFSPLDTRLSTLDYFYPGERSLSDLSSGAGQVALGELINLGNPDKTSFNLGGKLGGSCASCHARDSVERSVRDSTGQDAAALARIAQVPVLDPPMWAPFRVAIDQRNFNNVRQFGYGPAMTLGVSRRSINEAVSLARLYNDYFLGEPPQVSSKAGAAATNARRLPVRDTAGIRTMFATRCGYCHGFKRWPDLQSEAIAIKMACRIDATVNSAPKDAMHMPPGVLLPPEERDWIHAWASLQSCSKSLHDDVFRY